MIGYKKHILEFFWSNDKQNFTSLTYTVQHFQNSVFPLKVVKTKDFVICSA